MTRSRPVERGQEYVAVQAVASEPVPRFIRIRVVGRPHASSGGWNFGKVDVVTVTPDGRELRYRAIDMAQLHDSPTTRDGQPRKTGYVLDAKATP